MFIWNFVFSITSLILLVYFQAASRLAWTIMWPSLQLQMWMNSRVRVQTAVRGYGKVFMWPSSQQDFCLEIMYERRNRLDPEAQRCRRLYNQQQCDSLLLFTGSQITKMRIKKCIKIQDTAHFWSSGVSQTYGVLVGKSIPNPQRDTPHQVVPNL